MRNYWLFILIILGTWDCADLPDDPVDYTPYHLELPPGFPEPNIPENNQLTEARVALGKKLFFDPILSRDSTIACASCHFQTYAFSDTVAISPGIEGRIGFRNAPTLTNIAYLPVINKDGGVPKLDLQAGVPIADETEMDFSIVLLSERLNRHPEYVAMTQRAYGRNPDPFSITRALGAFGRTFISGNSTYDQFKYQDKKDALSESQKRGMELFFSSRIHCSNCHNGLNFTNNTYQNTGLHLDYSADLGRRRVTLMEEDIGKFRVPTLRNVGLTAPYMHDGSLPTLESVIDHYIKGGTDHPNKNQLIRPLVLKEDEKADLIAFLHSLSDSTFIHNPAFLP